MAKEADMCWMLLWPITAINIDIKDRETPRSELHLHLRSIRHMWYCIDGKYNSMTTYRIGLFAVYCNYLPVQQPELNRDWQLPSFSGPSREREECEGERRGGGGLLPCSTIYSLPGLVRRVISAEEVEYLVPEANIRFRPVEKYPSGRGGQGQLGVAGPHWHTRLVALYRAVGLYLLLRRGRVCLPLTHSVSAQPVLCYRTHGTTQWGSDIVVRLHHPPAQAHGRRRMLQVGNKAFFFTISAAFNAKKMPECEGWMIRTNHWTCPASASLI